MGSSRLFHGELDRYPIPTFEEQIELGRLIRRWLDHPEGEEGAPREVAHRGRSALNRLVSGNLRLVLSMASGYFTKAPGRLEEGDLVSAGVMGLIKAARKFDPERGYRFSTYATWWIRQGMQREVRAGGLIRTPDNIGELATKAKAIAGRMMAESGKEPSLEQVASELGPGVTVERLRHALHAWDLSTPTSANTRVRAADEIELMDSIAFGTTGDGWEELEQRERIEGVRVALARLDGEDSDLLRAIYYEGRTLRAVAKEFGVTPEAARLRLRKAKALLERQLRIQRR